MTPQQCHEHGEEPFFVYKGMLPMVVPPTMKLESGDGVSIQLWLILPQISQNRV